MGHRKNQRNRENQPKKGALDTNQDKSVEGTKQPVEEGAKPTEEKEEKEETMETETEEGMEEEKPSEETHEEDVVKGAEEEKVEETTEEAAVIEEAPEEAEKEEQVEELPTEEEEKKREEAPEEEIVEERIYTIPLGRAWISPRKKRTPRAVCIVRSFVQKHMKIEAKATAKEEEEEAGGLVISDEVNRKLWSRGIEKPPRKLRVRAVKDKEGIVTLYLAEGD